MLPLLVAAAEAIPAIGKIVDAITHHEDKATTAAKVAADPNAPPAVKQAAANMAADHVEKMQEAEKAGVQALTGKPAAQSDSVPWVWVGLGAILLLRK